MTGVAHAGWGGTAWPQSGLSRRPIAHGVTSSSLPDGASDADLLSRSAAGDARAFDEIVSRHGPRALRLAARLLPDPAVAEDVVQEAMIRTWSQASRFDPDRARFSTWLHRIVVNLCIDYRRRGRFEPLPDEFDPVDEDMSVDEKLSAEQRRSALISALQHLPPRYRAILALVYDEGLSGAEAARTIGVSAKTVERVLSRARGLLRDRLLPYLGP